jgi:lipopolysaccharide/colanic/teichoic acid biosynthesis glycosyltransferase
MVSTMQHAETTGPVHSGKARRVGDLVVAFALALLTLPLLVVVAVAIKCDTRGPVFSRVQRIDLQGRRFIALKFRITAYEPNLSGGRGGDITFVGGIIRFYRIDNLPQLFNVVRGEMTCIARHTGQLFFLE